MDVKHGAVTEARPSSTGAANTAASAPEVSPQQGRVRAVFFDVGDTLLRPRRPFRTLLVDVSQDLGIDLSPAMRDGLAARIDERVTDRTQRAQPFTFPAEVSRQFWYETYHDYFLGYLSESHASQLAERLLAELSSSRGYGLFDDTLDTLAKLRRDGYHLGIISNWEAWLPTLLEASGLAKYVDTVVTSGICGIEKPDSRIFTLALEETGFTPDEVVYVGDRPSHDVAPARLVGIRSILLDRYNRNPDHSEGLRVTSLDEIPAILSPEHREGRE